MNPMKSLPCIAAACLCLAAPAHANLLQNGSFEASSPIAQGSATYCYTSPAQAAGIRCLASPPNWSGEFVKIAASSGAWGTPSSLPQNQLIDGTVVAGIQGVSSLSQTLTLAAGAYELTWADANRNGYGDNQSYSVAVDNQVLGTFSTVAGQGWSARSLTFSVGAGLHTLTFAGVNLGGDRTSFIDAVQLTSAVPEPGALALVAAGLGMVMVTVRRRPH